MFFRRPQTWKLLIFLIPWFGAMMIAISRVSNYRHHWQDVLIGASLGIFIAIFVYRYLYYSLRTAHVGNTVENLRNEEEEMISPLLRS